MLIFGTNIHFVNETKKLLSSHFEMNYMGDVDVIIGIKIRKTNDNLSLCQSHYIEKVLKKFNCFDVLLVRTPYDPGIHLKKNEGPSVSQSEYAKIIRSVMFLMNYTQPGIAYAISRLSRYAYNLSKEHWNVLFRLLKYLQGTMNWCLHFSKFSVVLEGFCDANWSLITMNLLVVMYLP